MDPMTFEGGVYHAYLRLNNPSDPHTPDILWEVSATPLTVSIEARDTAVEGKTDYATGTEPGFYVRRNYPEDSPLTVSLATEHVTTAAGDFSLPSSATIPANELQ
jgi:hypothetical protein